MPRATADDLQPTDGLVQIGTVARLTDLSIRTIRHWEEVGLVAPSARSAGGFRLYSADDIARVRLLRFMKPLDFSLAQMRELLDMRELLASTTDAAEDRVKALVWPSGAGQAPDRAELADRLRGFVDSAERRLEKLRSHVAQVEEFADRLREEVRAGTDTDDLAGIGRPAAQADRDPR